MRRSTLFKLARSSSGEDIARRVLNAEAMLGGVVQASTQGSEEKEGCIAVD